MNQAHDNEDDEDDEERREADGVLTAEDRLVLQAPGEPLVVTIETCAPTAETYVNGDQVRVFGETGRRRLRDGDRVVVRNKRRKHVPFFSFTHSYLQH